jgi:hypothetical protein
MWLSKLRDKLLGISKLEYFLDKKVAQSVANSTKELKALQILQPYMPKSYVFESGFSMSFQAIQHIANDIVVYRPESILEVGSGLSTIILNNVIQQLDYNPSFISLDQDPDWQEHLKIQCPSVDFRSFSISKENHFSFQGKGSWFDIPAGNDLLNKTYDLIIVDGPKGSESKYARFGILGLLRGRLGKLPILFLDDTDRHDEKMIRDAAKEMLGFKEIKDFKRYSRLSFSDKFFTTPS